MQTQPCIYYSNSQEKCRTCEYRFTMTILWNVAEINEAKKSEPGESGWPDVVNEEHFHLKCDLDDYLKLANKKIVEIKGTNIFVTDLSKHNQI